MGKGKGTILECRERMEAVCRMLSSVGGGVAGFIHLFNTHATLQLLVACARTACGP